MTVAGIQSSATAKQRFGVSNGDTCCHSLEDHDIAFPRFPTVTSLMTFATAPWVIHLLSIGHLYTNQRLVKLIQKTAGSPSKLTVRCDFAASASPPIDSCSPE